MKKSQIFAFIVTGFFIVGCTGLDGSELIWEDNENTPQTQEKDGDSKPKKRGSGRMLNNEIDFTKPRLVPYYHVPEGWTVSPADRGAMKGSGLKREWTPRLYVTLNTPLDLAPCEARDMRLKNVSCESDENKMPLNCSISPKIGEFKVDGQKVCFLHYWGHWLNKNLRVEEYFFNHKGKTHKITLEGGIDADRELIKKLISTLEYKFEVFVPGEEEGMSGL